MIVGDERHSSNGWSDRVRRHLPSRDSKYLYPIPKRANKQSGLSLFHLPKNSGFRRGPLASGDVAGSLISDKGYDSDAQCISTPKQTMIPSEHAHLVAHVKQNMSPLRNVYHVEDPTQENARNSADTQQGEDGKTSDSQQPLAHMDWGSQSLRGATELACAKSQVASLVTNTPSHSGHDGNTESSKPASLSETSGISAGIGKAVTTPNKFTPDTNELKPRFYATVSQHGFRGINQANHAHAPYTTSSESLARHGMCITVAKKRQPASLETSSEARSLHLGDMDISKALASPSTSPRVLSQNSSIDEGAQWNKYSVRSLSDQYHDCAGRGRIGTLLWDKDGFDFNIPHRRETSSFYSPKSSISAAGIPRDLQFSGSIGKVVSSPVGSERQPSTAESAPVSPTSNASQEKPTSNIVTNDGPGPQTDAVRSKFVEEFGINRSISSGSIEALPPRKVSIGWMSGGRRLGYGYTLVSDDEEKIKDKDQETPTGSISNAVNENNGGANGAATESMAQESDTLSPERSSFDERLGFNSNQSASISQLSLRRWSGATALVGVTRSGNSTDRSSVPSSFWERFTRRSDQKDSGSNEAKSSQHSLFGADMEQAGEGRKRSNTWLETRNRGLLNRYMGVHFPLDSALDQHNAADECEMDAQAGPDATPFGSLGRPKGKLRVLIRRKRRNNCNSSDRRSILSAKRSIWAADSGPMSRKNIDSLIRARNQNSFTDFGPSQYIPKRTMRTDPDTVDQSSLEMHSDPE